MAKLFNAESGAFLGTVSDDDVQMMIDQLEEEDSADDDYYIDADTVDLLDEADGSPSLVELLRAAVGRLGGIDVRVEK